MIFGYPEHAELITAAQWVVAIGSPLSVVLFVVGCMLES